MNNQTQDKSELIYTRECDFETLSDTQMEIENLMRDLFADDIKLNFVTLSIIEVLANVFEHGSDETNNVVLAISRVDTTATATIKDDGKQIPDKVIAVMSGESMSMPDIDVQLDELPDSGWGLNLVQHACSSVNYRRDDNRNYLELNFDCNSAA